MRVLLLFLLPTLAFAQDLLPCRCSVAEVKAAPDARGYSYPPQWVIKEGDKVVGEMWNLEAATRAMYSSELMTVARCVAALTGTPSAAQIKLCADQATSAIQKIEAARK